MRLFGFPKYNDIEKALLDQYTEVMSATGMSSRDARRHAKDMLDKAIAKSKNQGSCYLPQNFGDIIMGDDISDNEKVNKAADIIRTSLPIKNSEGVSDDDVRWWWNLHDVERCMMLQYDDFTKMVVFISEREKGCEPSKSTLRVMKSFPKYGLPGNDPDMTDDDRPLPFELKNRINIYLENKAKDDQETFKREVEQMSSFNAFVRKEIRTGKL